MSHDIETCCLCGARRKGKHQCSVCGAKTRPLRSKDNVSVTINWQELRVLGTWAAEWASTKTGDELTHVLAICERLQYQYPKRPKLTLEVPGVTTTMETR